MLARVRRWLGMPESPPPPPEPDYDAAVEAWVSNMRASHLIAPVKGEVVWVPKSPKGSVWLVWRYMQQDPDMTSVRPAQGPTVKDATDDVAHSGSRLPGQVW